MLIVGSFTDILHTTQEYSDWSDTPKDKKNARRRQKRKVKTNKLHPNGQFKLRIFQWRHKSKPNQKYPKLETNVAGSYSFIQNYSTNDS